MDKRRRRQNGTGFSNSIQKSSRTEQNSNTMEGSKEKIEENQRGIFLISIVCKVYERVKNFQDENKKQIYQLCKLKERKAGQLWII